MFLNGLSADLIDNDRTWRLTRPLFYLSDVYGKLTVPEGFKTDLASVPRLPVIYEAWGNRAHREAVIHDYLYRRGCEPDVTRRDADGIFLEAMDSRNVSKWISLPMYIAVRLMGWSAWKKKTVI